MDTAGRLIRFISKELVVPLGDQPLAEDEDLLMSGRVDSLGIMRLIAFIEEEFRLTVPPEDVTLENFRSVRLIAGYLDKQRGANGGGREVGVGNRQGQ